MIAVQQAQDLTPESAAFLAQALPYDTGGPSASLDDMVRGCKLFELRDGARLVGAFAARASFYSDGPQLCVTAAGGLPGYDLTDAMHAWAIDQAAQHGFISLTCTTVRAGLVRKLRRAGYQVAGYVMRKDL